LKKKQKTWEVEFGNIGGFTGYPKKKLADLLEIDQTTLAGWERGEHQPTKKLIDKIESALVF